MAELIGLAASVAQLVGAATNLKSIYGAFSGAPTDFANLIDELSIRAKQFEESKGYLEGASEIHDGLVSECVRNFKQAQLAISAASNKIEKAFQHHHKHIASIKFVWESSNIQILRKKLERAQKLMERTETLIRQHEQSVARSLQSSQLQQIVSNTESLLRYLEQSKHIVNSNLIQEISPPSTPHRELESLRKVTYTGLNSISNGCGYKVVLPQWLWSKAIRLYFKQQQKPSINFTLRCHNVVPWNSDIFKAVGDNDLDRVKDLFNTGRADPLDVKPYGHSLLATATSFCHADMCEFLIRQGAEIGYTSYHGWSALHSLVAVVVNGPCGVTEYNYQKYKRSINKMVELLAGSIPDNEYGIEELATKFGFPEYLSSARFLLKGGLSDITLLSHEDRARLIMNTDSLDMIKDLLGSDLSVRQVFMFAQQYGLPHRRHLETFLAKPGEERDRWYPLIRELLALDQTVSPGDFHHQGDTRSIVMICLDEITSRTTQMSNHHLQAHLATLQDLGADLDAIGQTEQHILRCQGWYTRCFSFEGSFEFRWRIYSVETGPRPCDWRIRLMPVDCEYEWAGQFWHWIENPELYIPGAFMEGDSW